MVEKITLDGESLDPAKVWQFAARALDPKAQFKIELAPNSKERINAAASFVAEIINGDRAVYGINTGFGNFAEVRVEHSELLNLQRNIILSHACGVGEPLSRDLVMAMWILRLNTACRGNNGIRLSTIEGIISFLEKGILAEVPSRGSVGASGDLCPSAHATLAIIGEGFCTAPIDGEIKRVSVSEALKVFNLKALTLGPKEGLSLLNGTQTTTALAIKAWSEGTTLLRTANLGAAMMIEGLRGSHQIVHDGVLESRNHPGTLKCGNEIKKWLGTSTEISESHKNCSRVQDAYSLRCAPQVHGAISDELDHAEEVLRREINASTDNPLVFADIKETVSGGNFHALYTARVSDALASALTSLANISERRMAQAMDKETSGLPTFLIKNGGLHSGFMMAQTTAAALVSEAKTQSFPASVDSIPTNGDREDHVSMGPGAGFKALQVASLARNVLAIELFAAAQALDMLAPLKSSAAIQKIHATIRKKVAYLEKDRILSTDMKAIEELISSGELFEGFKK